MRSIGIREARINSSDCVSESSDVEEEESDVCLESWLLTDFGDGGSEGTIVAAKSPEDELTNIKGLERDNSAAPAEDITLLGFSVLTTRCGSLPSITYCFPTARLLSINFHSRVQSH